MKRALLAAAMVLGCISFARPADAPESIYSLPAPLIDQDGVARRLDLDRGHQVLIAMFYSNCQASCPLIIDTLRATETAMTDAERARVRVLMISFDPERDTPARLRAVADERHIDTTRWTLAHAGAGDVRKIAALLNVLYRKLPGGDFNHSNVITLLAPDGEILARSSELGHADPELLAALRRQ